MNTPYTLEATIGTFLDAKLAHDGAAANANDGGDSIKPGNDRKEWTVSTEIVIRAVSREDFPAWQVLWDGYNAFYGREGRTKLTDEVVRMTWSRFFDSYEPVHAVVAERAGALLGLAHFLFHRSTIHIGPLCYMQDLFTAESARGHGVGRALIGAVYERAAAAGSSRVYWMTHETNSVAMTLYDKVAEKSGFIVYRHFL
jgi:GNAT superfamily N-acetyltransferase